MRVFMLMLLISFVILLTSCAASMEEIAWDSRFIDYFRPTERILELTQGAVQNINKEYVCGDYTLRIAQILGDAKTVYIAADIIFPAEFDLAELMPPDAANEIDSPSILPLKTRLVDGVVGYDEIKDLSWQEIEEQSRFKTYTGGGGGVQTYEVNYEENSIAYVFSFSRDTGRFSSDGLSLIISDAEYRQQGGEYKQLDEYNIVASWKPKRNNSKILEWQLLDAEGKTVGSVDLSYFALSVELFYVNYVSYEEFRDTIVFFAQDGESFRARGFGGGSASGNTDGGVNHVQVTIRFHELLPLEDIATLQVGDYILEVNP